MAFLKKAVLLGIIVAMMPTDEAQQARFAAKASEAMQWTATFCDRNASLCLESKAAWDVMVKKAEFGATVAYNLIQSQWTAASGGLQPAQHRPLDPHGPLDVHGTLRADDLRPSWRGPSDGARRGI